MWSKASEARKNERKLRRRVQNQTFHSSGQLLLQTIKSKAAKVGGDRTEAASSSAADSRGEVAEATASSATDAETPSRLVLVDLFREAQATRAATKKHLVLLYEVRNLGHLPRAKGTERLLFVRLSRVRGGLPKTYRTYLQAVRDLSAQQPKRGVRGVGSRSDVKRVR